MEEDQQASFAGLLKMARKEALQHDIEIETVLGDGSVTVSLSKAVKKNHIDLLVLGSIPTTVCWDGCRAVLLTNLP